MQLRNHAATVIAITALGFILPTFDATAQPGVPCQIQDPRVRQAVKWGRTQVFNIGPQWIGALRDAPGNYRFWFDQSRGQYGFFWGGVNHNGNGTSEIDFEVRNEADIDGDRFALVFGLADAYGNILESWTWVRGINAARFCKATGQGHDCWRGGGRLRSQLPRFQLEQVRQIRIKTALVDTYDDATVIRNISNIAQCIFLIP